MIKDEICNVVDRLQKAKLSINNIQSKAINNRQEMIVL